MHNISSLIKKNKKAALIAIFFLIIFIGFSITNSIKVAHYRGAADDANKEVQTEDIKVKDIVLTENQEELIKNYDAKTKEFIHILSSNPWTTDDGKNVLTFHENYYEETINNKTKKIPFAISTMNMGSNGSDMEIRTIVFEVENNKSHIVTFTQVKAKSEKETGYATLQSATLFNQLNTPYSHVKKIIPLAIEGLTDNEAMTFLGSKDALAEKMAGWAATHYPTMTAAVWTENISLKFTEDNIISTTAFYLGTSMEDVKNNKTQALIVTVIYDKEKNSYLFKL